MIQRFQIEDLVTQDISGVVFRALDTRTNRPVELRRFFPFGATAGGLRENEQVTYTAMVENLALINHPALRAIIGGGCDPVDAMPFLATEWLEGTTLQSAIEHQPYPTEDATMLLRQALEVCELLSQALGDEAVWVETNLQDILIGAEGSGREVTFSFAPQKWLGEDHARRGLGSLITLCESLIIWKGKSVAGHAGQGLDGWLKWLRGAAATTTLREAREKLPAPVRAETPVPAMSSVPAPKPAASVRKRGRTSNLPFFLGTALALAVFAYGGWVLIQHNNAKQAALIVEEPEEVEDLEIPPVVAASEAGDIVLANALPDKVFTPADRSQLIARKSQHATLEGMLETISHSKSGKSIYLSFSKQPSHDEPHGRISVKGAPENLSEASLTPLIGRKIRLQGTVRVEKIGQIERPYIVIKTRDAIREIK